MTDKQTNDGLAKTTALRSTVIPDWSDDFATGIAIIDFDHQQLFNVTKTLAAAIQNGESQREIESTIGHLIDYIARHFRREEKLFEATDYPDRDAHKARHRDIENTVKDIAVMYKSDPSTIHSTELLDFLKVWLTKHIMKADREFIPFLIDEELEL